MEAIRWTAWPAQRSPLRALLAIGFIALVGWTLAEWLGSPLFALVAMLLLSAQVVGFFVPTRYELDEERVVVRGLVGRQVKPWSDFHSYYVDPEGVLLSPFVERSRLERFRGVSLQFHGNRDEVVQFVEDRMGREEGVERDVGDEGQGEARGEEGRAS